MTKEEIIEYIEGKKQSAFDQRLALDSTFINMQARRTLYSKEKILKELLTILRLLKRRRYCKLDNYLYIYTVRFNQWIAYD